MEYAILGPIEVRDAGAVRPVPGIKERVLLGLLIVEAGTVVSVDRMIFELWGDDQPPTALRTLRSHVSRLRRALGPRSELVTRRPGYLLDASTDDIDASRFEALADRAQRLIDSDPADAGRTASMALGLWRGAALDDLHGHPFAETEARRLTERRLAVTELDIEASLRVGDDDSLIPRLTSLVRDNPFHERFWGQLMLALHRAGRTGDALRTYGDAARALGETLGIEPSLDLRNLERAIVMDDAALRRPVATRHNLPTATSSFVGRDRELGALTEAMGRSRMVTLTGPGGCGKSRLAIEAAGSVLASFPDGVWRTELATIADPELVPIAVSASLGEPASHAAQPLESLARFLEDRRALIVLDNCEHVLDACAAVATALLTRCPSLRILTTSREPLRIPGETVWIVPPLQLPDPTDPQTTQETAEAYRLFVERARETDSRFQMTSADREAVAGICRAVSGLPLAIELAAARSRVLSPVDLADRLESGLDALGRHHRGGPIRHRTMRAAIDWSVQTLDVDRRADFAGLGVFNGGWTLDAADAVLSRGGDTVDAMSELADRSLLQVERGPERRYRLLEPIRQFAAEMLDLSGTAPLLRQRHAEYFLSLAEQSDRELRGPGQRAWLDRIETEHNNVRAALRWALDTGHIETAQRLVAAMGRFWFMAGHWRDAWQWLEESLSASSDSTARPRALAISRTGGIQVIRRNAGVVLPLLEAALATARRVGDVVTEAWCLHLIAHDQLESPTDETLAMLVHARTLFETHGHEWEVAWSDRYIGDALAALGEATRGIETQLRSIDMFRSLGDRWSTAYGFHNLAGALFIHRSPAEARPYFVRCLRLAEEIADPVWTAHGKLGVAVCDFLDETGDPESLLADAKERFLLIGDDNCLVNTTGYLGRVLQRTGDDTGAAAHYLEAVRVARRIDKLSGIAINLDRIASIAARAGSHEQAGRLVGAVDQALSTGVVAFHGVMAEEHQAIRASVGAGAGRRQELVELIPLAAGLVQDLEARRRP